MSTSRGIMRARLKSTIASATFIAAPEPRTTSRIQRGFAARLRGSSGSSSPSSLTKPPKGSALIVYSVSPRLMPQRRGGYPMPNSSTFTPASFAVMKCPSSWTTMSTTIIATNGRTDWSTTDIGNRFYGNA